jgi:hypothetical protein
MHVGTVALLVFLAVAVFLLDYYHARPHFRFYTIATLLYKGGLLAIRLLLLWMHRFGLLVYFFLLIYHWRLLIILFQCILMLFLTGRVYIFLGLLLLRLDLPVFAQLPKVQSEVGKLVPLLEFESFRQGSIGGALVDEWRFVAQHWRYHLIHMSSLLLVLAGLPRLPFHPLLFARLI